MKAILICIYSVLLFTSCKTNQKSNATSFNKSIVDSSIYERLQQDRKILNYSGIENGVDSIEIRLWSSLGHTNLNVLDILKYEDANWHYSNTRYWFSGDSIFPNEGSKIFLDSSNVKSAELLLSFSTIIDSLKVINWKTLPSQSQINGFSDNIADGWNYNLEIATKSSYRHLFYHEPKHFSDTSNEKFMRIVKLFSIKSAN